MRYKGQNIFCPSYPMKKAKGACKRVDNRIRTDLALETKESFDADNVEVQGVKIEEDYDKENDIQVTKVVIETRDGARIMGKPMGNYLTLEAPDMVIPDKGYHREISKVVCKYLKELLGEERERSILVAGLGNREVTPDSLGPLVVSNLLITRHVIKEYGAYGMGEDSINSVSSIVPGVMAQTGMEPAEILKAVIKETSPDVLIVIDALAARSVKRLNKTIQLTDTGIHPGSGVGNHRNAINEGSMGIPVIAVGVPTVVDAGVIVRDAIENMAVYEKGKVDISSSLNSMFVTPKDIDETVKRISFTISEALNMAFSSNLNELGEKGETIEKK